MSDLIPTDTILATEQDPGWQPDPAHPRRRPPWIKVRAPHGEEYERVHALMRSKTLHTVCEEAQCPNIGECWGRGTATFLMMGDTCTRSCGFCDIKTGRPSPLDWAEPNRVAEVGARDEPAPCRHHQRQPRRAAGRRRADFRDGHSPHPPVAARVQHRSADPGLQGQTKRRCNIVMDAQPEILNHNVETVPRLFKKVQPQDHYEWAMTTLATPRRMDPLVLTKSGIMVGLGETFDEVVEVMRDLAERGVDILTIGQYLQPSTEAPADRALLHSGRVRRASARSAWNWASSGSKAARWCAAATTPTSRCVVCRNCRSSTACRWTPEHKVKDSSRRRRERKRRRGMSSASLFVSTPPR